LASHPQAQRQDPTPREQRRDGDYRRPHPDPGHQEPLGIPLLSDLPLIGRLFSQIDTREEKRDLLILITPHIIDEGEAIRPPNYDQN
jgi:hypothetical protein